MGELTKNWYFFGTKEKGFVFKFPSKLTIPRGLIIITTRNILANSEKFHLYVKHVKKNRFELIFIQFF
jgi:hypothetical protein